MDSPQTGAADRPVRWGILATGSIAGSFARDLAVVPGTELAAVGSRRRESADAFAAAHGARRAHGSYASLVADPEVDVVYVATPHALHLEHTRLALEAGKPVLCEKALTLNTREATTMVDLARQRGLFLMEAMWMACNPLVRHLRERCAAGDFGRVRQVRADLGFCVSEDPRGRLLDPDLGGGALLDMGIYPLTFAHLFLGEPEYLTATAVLDHAGVDRDVAVSARYAGGAVASLTASMSSWSPRTASIATDRGRIDLVSPFHVPRRATWTPYDGGEPGTPEVIEPPEPLLGTGLGNEAAEVARCLRAGLLESPLVPHEQTLSLMGQLDTLRRQVGVRYAADDDPRSP